MSNDKYAEVASKYRVDDLAGASIPSSRLAKILKDIETGKPISRHAQDFLMQKGLLALLGYAKKEITFIEFLQVAESEQAERRQAAEAAAQAEAQKRLAEQQARDAEWKLRNEAVQANLRQIAETRVFHNFRLM